MAIMVITILVAFGLSTVVMIKSGTQVWSSESSLDAEQRTRRQEIVASRRSWEWKYGIALLVFGIAMYAIATFYNVQLFTPMILVVTIAFAIFNHVGNLRTLREVNDANFPDVYRSALRKHYLNKRWVQIGLVVYLIFFGFYFYSGI